MVSADNDDKLAPIRAADIRTAGRWLAEFLRLLPEVRFVLALAATARRGLQVDDLRLALGRVRLLAAPHPSQRVYNRPGFRARERVHAAFAEAAGSQ